MSLKSVYNILEELSATTKKLEKEKIIEEHKDDDLFKNVVFYAYDPFKRFNVSDLKFKPGKSYTVDSI